MVVLIERPELLVESMSRKMSTPGKEEFITYQIIHIKAIGKFPDQVWGLWVRGEKEGIGCLQ